MADEIKETSAAEATPETPKKKRDWKGKRLPIVIAVVVAATVLGVAGWAWRATPGYCDALCHSTMGKYYDTFENQTDSLAYAHKAVVNGKCLDCHENTLGTSARMVQSQLTGDHDTPLAKVTYTNEFCLQSGCHAGAGIMPARASLPRRTSRLIRIAITTAYSSAIPATACTTRASSRVPVATRLVPGRAKVAFPRAGARLTWATASRVPCRMAGPLHSCSRLPNRALNKNDRKGRAFRVRPFHNDDKMESCCRYMLCGILAAVKNVRERHLCDRS